MSLSIVRDTKTPPKCYYCKEKMVDGEIVDLVATGNGVVKVAHRDCIDAERKKHGQ